MSNLKALILGILLLVPILILAFVGIFGEHHFGLPNYYPALNNAGEVQYTAGGDTVFHQIPDFELVSHEGKNFTAADLDDAIYVTHFFSTNCSPACRRITSQLVRIQEAFETNPEVKIVSITTAPETDSVAALRNFATRYGAREDKWFFLTGDRQEVYALAEEGFFLPLQGQQPEATYNEQLRLVDKEGNIRGIYDGTDLAEMDRLITEINVLLDGYSKRK